MGIGALKYNKKEMSKEEPEQYIVHVDMDAFYASVEMRDDPFLRDKPLIIGSLPHERGVVSTCNYEARKYGVRSGMNIKEAYRLCPRGIYRHPDFNKYRSVSQKLHEIWYSYASEAEAISLDEAYLDISEQAKDLEGARRIARAIKQRTKAEVDLTCSVGLAYSKTAAKTASEEKKPDGYFEILSPQDFVDLVKDRDVRVLYTVGVKTAEKLHEAGIHTVKDIQENTDKVISLLGKQGRWISRIAFGIDNEKVKTYHPEDAKSIGREVTFQQDVDDYMFLEDVLVLLSLSVWRRLKKVGSEGNGVSLKLTYSDMQSISRSRLTEDIGSAYDIYRNAIALLRQVKQRRVRLVGVSIYNLSSHKNRQLSLFAEAETEKDEREGFEELFAYMERRYGLDFYNNLDKIFAGETLYRTIEYMRKHF